MFICGRRSFGDEDGDKNGKHMRPKRLKKSKGSSKRNPYADGGLEKFQKLLADVEEEKQKIYRQNRAEAEDISLVRFVYSDSFKHVRPVVVRGKNNNRHGLALDESTTSSPAAVDEERGDGRREEKGRAEEKKEVVGVMMVLVLVFVVVVVAIYGRSFAILCTTLMWYLVPAGIFRGRSMRKLN